jgi:hypothetical protein
MGLTVSFFLGKHQYIKLVSHLIKNLPVPLDTLEKKRVHLKLVAKVKVLLHRLTGHLEGTRAVP